MKKKEYRIEDNLIDQYFQKSLKFLYPFVSTPVSILPIQTYLAWENHYTVSQNRLICLFKLSEEAAYNQFEKKLMRHDLFETSREMEDNKIVYIFNFNKYEADMNHFHHGSYSCFSTEWKEIILNHYTANKATWKYIDSYLKPEQYFEKYAALLNVKEELLWSVGELCNRFNPAKETLCLKEISKRVNAEKLMLF